MPSKVALFACELVFFLCEPGVDQDINHSCRVWVHRVDRLHIGSVYSQ